MLHEKCGCMKNVILFSSSGLCIPKRCLNGINFEYVRENSLHREGAVAGLHFVQITEHENYNAAEVNVYNTIQMTFLIMLD